MQDLNLGNVNNRIFGIRKRFEDTDFREITVYEDGFIVGNLMI